jgi:hypothetical protein
MGVLLLIISLFLLAVFGLLQDCTFVRHVDMDIAWRESLFFLDAMCIPINACRPFRTVLDQVCHDVDHCAVVVGMFLNASTHNTPFSVREEEDASNRYTPRMQKY